MWQSTVAWRDIRLVRLGWVCERLHLLEEVRSGRTESFGIEAGSAARKTELVQVERSLPFQSAPGSHIQVRIQPMSSCSQQH